MWAIIRPPPGLTLPVGFDTLRVITDVSSGVSLGS